MILKKLFIGKVLLISLLSACTPPKGAQPGKVESNGITIAYESFGDPDNEAIILIQGTGATLLHYPVELCETLAAKGYHVIRFDNRDVGLSTHLDSLGQPNWEAIIPLIGTCEPAPLPYTLVDMATDVTGLMDALAIEKAHIAGASMGGAIAQLVAIHFPGRVLSLTCMAASSGNPNLPQGDEKALKAMGTPPPTSLNPDTIANYLVTIYQALGAADDQEVLRQRALNHVKYRNWNPASVNRQVAAVIIGDQCDRREKLSKLKMPTLVIHGDADPLVTLDSGKEIAATIPGAELYVVPGMGHDVSLKFVGVIADKIAEVASRANTPKE
jgi:pimeloyl-ACP methyl ester carboxylesterase